MLLKSHMTAAAIRRQRRDARGDRGGAGDRGDGDRGDRGGADLEPLWRALADPTRRKILDLLRQRPHTTGELADAFPTSRFAVMKHLTVLSRAGLVLSRRRWRERWNHLNAVPLQELVERWVRPYEAAWASGLLQLERRVMQLTHPADQGDSMTTDPAQPDSPQKPGPEAALGTAEVAMEISIDAPRDRVWRALVADIGAWWRKDFLHPRARSFTLDPRPGGRVVEDWGDGEGRLWYTVVSLEAPGRLQLVGHLMPGDCGGSAGTSHLTLELEEREGRTTIALSDVVIGRLRPDLRSDLAEGWQLLFRDALKPFVEKAARP